MNEQQYQAEVLDELRQLQEEAYYEKQERQQRDVLDVLDELGEDE